MLQPQNVKPALTPRRASLFTINALQTDLSTPAIDWEFRPNFDLGADFTDIVSKIEHSPMFEPETAKAIKAEGVEGLRRLQADLARRTGLGFPVLKLRSSLDPATTPGASSPAPKAIAASGHNRRPRRPISTRRAATAAA